MDLPKIVTNLTDWEQELLRYGKSDADIWWRREWAAIDVSVDNLTTNNVSTRLEDYSGRTFHQFSSLPTEIRHQIWSYLIPSHRLVIAWLDGYELTGPMNDEAKEKYITSPLIFRINRDSRAFALTKYHLLRTADNPCMAADKVLNYHWYDVNDPKCRTSSVYFNPETDLLFLIGYRHISPEHTAVVEAARVRYLAYEGFEYLYDRNDHPEECAREFLNMALIPSLRQIVFVHNFRAPDVKGFCELWRKGFRFDQLDLIRNAWRGRWGGITSLEDLEERWKIQRHDVPQLGRVNVVRESPQGPMYTVGVNV